MPICFFLAILKEPLRNVLFTCGPFLIHHHQREKKIIHTVAVIVKVVTSKNKKTIDFYTYLVLRNNLIVFVKKFTSTHNLMSHTTLSEISTDIVKLPLQLNIVVFRNGLVRVFALICDIFWPRLESHRFTPFFTCRVNYFQVRSTFHMLTVRLFPV